MKKQLVLVLVLIGQLLYAGQAKYIFLFIGDGMAVAQRQAADYYLAATMPGSKQLEINTFPVQALTTTRSKNSYITDSAAAGTALACGKKTNSGMISMLPDGTKLKSIAYTAKEKGLKVGIISSVSLDHATPACFFATEKSRNHYYEISDQLTESNFDYFGGGGSKGNSSGIRKGRPDIYEKAKANGYKLVTTRKEMLSCTPGEKVWAYNHTLEGSAALYYEIDRPEDHITLAEFTSKGIELLDNDKGFFMMVEGGKIDWACHSNDAVTAIKEVIAFDDAVKEALKFYKKHPEETLIVITGDHETGGITLGFARTGYKIHPKVLSKQKMSYQNFNGQVSKWRDSKTDFETALPVAKGIFGFTSLSGYESRKLAQAYQQSMLDRKKRDKSDEAYLEYGGKEPFTSACTHLLNNQAGLAWSTWSHTATPVQTSAIGSGSELFNGSYDNTMIPQKMLKAMGL